jgi:hypothetical protein
LDLLRALQDALDDIRAQIAGIDERLTHLETTGVSRP